MIIRLSSEQTGTSCRQLIGQVSNIFGTLLHVIFVFARFSVFVSILTTALVLISSNVHARQSDFTQPILINGDRSEYDEKTGIHIWSGNVEITQGTMQIKADSVTITLRDNKLSRVEGTGSPIQFQQENEAGELVTGKANAIDYNAENNSLALSGSATLTQPGQRLQSERIVFDINRQKVSAEGGDNGRVSIQIQPPDPK